MATTIKNYKTISATGKLDKHDLTHQHITTNDFGIIKPIFLKYVVPGDKFDINVSEFTRLMPMAAPTFGRLQTITRAYFIPCRIGHRQFLQFLSDNYTPVGNNLLTQSIPFTTEYELNALFAGDEYSTEYTGTGKFDMLWQKTSSSTKQKRRLTTHGKRIKDFLSACGLNFPLFPRSPQPLATSNDPISLLPIFCALRTYYDWVVPARYVNSNKYHKLIGRINQTLGNTSVNSMFMNHGELDEILFETRSMLEEDFFTSAWEYPTHMLDGTKMSGFDIPILDGKQQTSDGSYWTNSNVTQNGTSPVHAQLNDGNMSALTMYTLGALQDMATRGMLAGTKVGDWLKVEFGIEQNSLLTDTSTYLGMHSNDIMIGDVMNTSDTSSIGGAYLGQFAGKGLGGNDSHFHYETKEHGYLFITNEIIPRTSYYQGLHPEFTMFDRFDFFQPELDNLGTEPVPLSLLVNDYKVSSTMDMATMSKRDNIFGFVPKYASLKMHLDSVTGDFRIPTLNTGLDSWFLARDFDLDSTKDAIYKEISLPFNDASNGTSTNSYDRIFQYQGNEDDSLCQPDHFYQIFVLKITAHRPMQSVSKFGLPQHETDGKQVTVSPNGN